ncbi:MAG: transglutaminase domain-containing protein [bacterium]
MKTLPRFLYLLCFIGLAAAAALALNRVVQPSMATILLRAVIVAAAAGAPGLIYRRLWPLSLVLLPLGAYLLLRTIMPVPALVDGIGGQYHFYVEQLRLGASAYVGLFFPLNLTDAPELRLLLAFSVYWLTGAAALSSLSLRRPIPAIVLILVLLGFGLTVDTASRVIWLAVLFLVLAACLLVLSRGLKREGWRLRDAAAGGAVGVVASLLALALLAAAPSAVAAPWQDWRAWDPFRQSGSVYSFNWLQNYPKLLNPANNVLIMRIESPSPSYWRANALDTFTGSAWVTSQAFLRRMEPVQTGGSYVYSIPAAEPTPAGKTVTQVFQVESVYTNYFFAGGDPQSLSIDQNLALRINEMRSLHVSKALGPTLAYRLIAVIPELKPPELVGKGTDYPRALDRYLTLPFPRLTEVSGPDKEAGWRSLMPETGPDGWEWVDLYRLNQTIIGDASDPYDLTLRIERYLRTFFDYSLAPPPSEYSSPYAAFLFDTRSGYCQHFSGAMALLLRYNGIPARVAVGFTSGELEGADVYTVSTNNAHAWVEVYFPEVGWVAFDPTPGRSVPSAGASSTSPGFINPFIESGTSEPGTVTSQAPRENIPEGGATGGETSGAEARGWLGSAAWLPWVAGLVVLLVAWPLARGLWRRRRLGRGSLEQRLQASLGLLRAQISDYGVAAVPSHTLEETLHLLHAHLGIDPDPVLIDRADAVLFGGRPATEEDLDRVEALRRDVNVRLRRRYGWVKTGFGWYGVPRFTSA